MQEERECHGRIQAPGRRDPHNKPTTAPNLSACTAPKHGLQRWLHAAHAVRQVTTGALDDQPALAGEVQDLASWSGRLPTTTLPGHSPAGLPPPCANQKAWCPTGAVCQRPWQRYIRRATR